MNDTPIKPGDTVRNRRDGKERTVTAVYPDKHNVAGGATVAVASVERPPWWTYWPASDVEKVA